MSWMGEEFHAHLDRCERCSAQPFNLCAVGAALLQRSASAGAEHVSQRPELDVTFVGCRVVVLDHAEVTHPSPLSAPVFMIEPLGPCDGLLVTSVRVGTSDDLLAVPEVPAAVFEEPPPVVLCFPRMDPGVALRLEFANRASEPACFLIWLGSQEGISLKHERRELERAKRRARAEP